MTSQTRRTDAATTPAPADAPSAGPGGHPSSADAAPARLVQSPTFLVGAERSGTTLLRLMLTHHPRIKFHHEFEYIVDRIGDRPGDWPDARAYADYLRTEFVFSIDRLEIDPSLDYPRLIDSFLHQVRQKSGKPFVGATVHRGFDKLLWIWPEARFIHLLRDGRDVARSVIQMGWNGNLWTAADRWIEAEERWARLAPALPPERKLEITYEQLISNPETTLARCCELIGVAYDPGMLDYHVNTTYERPDPKLIAQWRRKLSDEEIRLAEARIGPMLAERGYAPSGLPPLEVDEAMQRRLRRQDRWWRLNFRRKRHGAPLILLDYVLRRTGPRALAERVRRRMQEIDRKYVK